MVAMTAKKATSGDRKLKMPFSGKLVLLVSITTMATKLYIFSGKWSYFEKTVSPMNEPSNLFVTISSHLNVRYSFIID